MNLSTFEKISKALADSSRVQILEDIVKNPMQTCLEVCSKMDIGQPTVSHHIKILKESGLVDFKKEGQHIILWSDNKLMDKYLMELKSRFSSLPAKA